MRRLLLTLLAAGLVGCPSTSGDYESPVTGSLVQQMTAAAGMAATLGMEIAGSVAADPGPGGCPDVLVDGPDVTLDYGNGCLPSSGLSDQMVGGSAELLVPTSGSLYTGDAAGLGFQDLPVVGAFSGDVNTTSTTVGSDFDWDSFTWTKDGAEHQLAGLFRFERDDDGVTVSVPELTLTRGGSDPIVIEWDGVHIATGMLGPCVRPDGGTMSLEFQTITADLEFSTESGANGALSVTYSDREAENLVLCP